MATGYRSAEGDFDDFPAQQSVLYHCDPTYDELPGWREDITGIREYDDLPKEAQAYIEYIQDSIGVPVGWVSVGPERSQLIELS